MRKRLLSVLLTLVMLLSLVPAVGPTASAADTESHPTKVDLLGETHEAYYIAEGVFMFAENNTGSSSEDKWNAYKSRLHTKITEDAGIISGKNIEGVAYYDRASGVLYITGNVYTCVSVVVTSTARDDVLKVVVDGNTINDGGWCVTEVNHCLDKLNIEFRNNGTLTLRKRSGNSAVLGVIGYNGQPGSVNWGTDPFWFGDLELSGTGKLKIDVSDDEQKLLCGIRARDISIKDNVSLDIKMGKSNASVMYRCNAAMICKSLTINTTGTVQIDTALEDSSNRFSVFAPIADYYVNYNVYGDPVNSFNLVNAQSVTLKSNAKNELFDTRFGFGGKQDDLGDRICDDLETKGWMVTKSADGTKPYTVTMTRKGLSDAELTVGTNEPIPLTAPITKGQIQANGGKQDLTINKVKVPKWLTTLYKAERVGYDYTAAVYENGNKLSNTFNLTTDDSSDGTSTVTLTGDFTPAAGKSYIVTFTITPKVKATGEKLKSAAISGNWLLTTVAKPVSQVLSGSILYTSGVRYGAEVTTARTGVVNDIASDKLHYQWQVKNGDTWTDISDATAGKLDADKVNTVVGKDIRLKITADGYEGVVYSPVKTVAKAVQTAIPVTPVLGCTIGHDNAIVKVTNLQSDQEYLRSSSPMTDEQLAAAYSNKWDVYGYFLVSKGRTFYIYTRMKETDTHAAGTIYRYSTIYTGDEVPLTGLTLEGYTNKIYVKKGEPLTINVVGTPANANKWNAIHFINQNSTSSDFTVKVDHGENNFILEGTGSTTFGNHTITITSDNVGSHTLVAFPTDTYNPYATPFGSWTVVVYEPGNITNFDIIDPPTYTDVTLAVGESYAPELTKPTLTTKPAEAMTGHTLKWFVMTPATSTGVPTYSDSNGYISVDANGKVTALAANDTVNDDYKVVALHVVDGAGHFVKSVASYKVTVTAATAPTLKSISVHPGALTLKNGESANLTAIKNPVDAENIVTWSSDTDACTVDNTGKVTAVSEGTATITATCNGKTATCTVYVIAEGHTHSYGAWTYDDNFHYYRICTTCPANDDTQAGPHNWTVTGTTPATLTTSGSISYKCDTCNATKSDVLAKLTAITDAGVSVTAPAYGDTPSGAYASSGEFSVANVTWGPTVSGSFAANTVYTVKVVLEASGSNRFTNATQFTINGQTATVVGTIPDTGAETVTLTYQFPATGSAPAPVPAYTVTVLSSKNGVVTADRKTASAGATVTLTVTPDKGYTLETLSVLDKSGKEIKLTEKNGKYTFTMPASSVEVKATFMDDNTMLNFFVDVKAGDYFYDAVLWAAEKGITGGTDATHFTPNGVCTRAQAVTFLWRAAGSPAPKSAAMPFTDVPKGSYYEQAVLWAVENGITKGTSDTTFSPNLTCSRAQIVTFLWRSQKSPAAGSVNPFTDVKSDAYYADAVLWAVKESVTSGTTAATFSPNADCTRAQIVTFIYRALAE